MSVASLPSHYNVGCIHKSYDTESQYKSVNEKNYKSDKTKDSDFCIVKSIHYYRHPYHLLKVIGQCICLWDNIKYGDNLYDMQVSLPLMLPLDKELAQYFCIL